MLHGEVPKIPWTVGSHRSMRRLRLNVFLAFRCFGVRHFCNPDEEDLGHFALKIPKSRNVTWLWSRDVAPEEVAISTFRHFNISGYGRSKDQEPSAAETVELRILKSR
jgi:hypothetical protein